MIFRKIGCLVVTSNSVKLKSISSWPNFRAKTTENHFRFHFHFKWLPALENRRERERDRERQRERERERERGRKKESIATSPSGAVAPIPIAIAISTSIFARSRSRSTHRVNASIAIAITGWRGSVDRDLRFDLRAIAIAIDASRERVDRDRDHTMRRPLWSRSRRSRSRLRLSEFDDFFLGFVCILRNEWYYIFIWWPRKCEKMCFLWYFQEHKQTSENIFRNIFWNATKHMKTFSFPENSIFGKYLFSRNTFTRTKRRLSRIVFLIH